MFLLSRTLRISTSRKGLPPVTSARPAVDFRFLFSSATARSSDDDESEKAHSFTVSYLVGSCGLSPESAINASKKVQLQNPRKPDSVIAFLRAHEFSDSDISCLVAKRPDFLMADPESTFLPKLEFFHSKGISKKKMAKFFCSCPYLLHRSLNNHIIPIFEFYKRFFTSDEEVIAVMFTPRDRLGSHLENISTNIEFFRELGFNHSSIGTIMLNFSDVMILNPDRLIELVNKVRGMGFVPEKYTFLFALRMLSQKSYEEKWRNTYSVYERWGWSEEEIVKAFRYHPNCMLMSEEKIEKTMEFLVKEMGYSSKRIARCPVVLFYSLEKRIIPRLFVVSVLLSKGLIEESEVSLGSVLQIVEKQFLERYVVKYTSVVPLLLSVYRREILPKDA